MALLEEADRLRGIDPPGFLTTLADAERARGRMSPIELDYLRFLQAYRDTLSGQYRTALVTSRDLARNARLPAIRFRASVLVINLGAITRDYSEALRHLTHALELAPGIPDKTVRTHVYSGAANLYNELEQYPRALVYARKLIAEGPTPRNRCHGHEARARAFAYTLEAGHDKAFLDGRAACEAAGDRIGLPLVRTSYGRYLLRTGRAGEAIRELEATRPLAQATGYTRLIGELNATLALAYHETGDEGGAEAAARRTVASAGSYAHWRPLVVAHEVLYRIAERRGDYRRAFEHFHRHHIAQRAALDEARARELAVQLTRHDAIVREQSARALQQQNRILRLQQSEAEARARALRLTILCMGLFVAAVAYWAWQSRRTQRILRRLNETDALTGLASRRHFSEKADRMLADCERRGDPVAIVLLDLDHFKRVNDECGHAVGDWVLREVARVGQACLGEGSLFGRVGGEEFALLLPGRDAVRAHAVAETLRRELCAIDGLSGGCHLPITASIGLADSVRSGYGYRRLLGDADRAMYAAKMAGRNRIMHAGSIGVDLPACA